MEITYKVAVDNLTCRSEPNMAGKDIGTVRKGTTVVVTSAKKDTAGRSWGKHTKGWSCITGSTGTVYLTKVTSTSTASKTTTKSKADTASSKPKVIPTNTKKTVAYEISTGSSFKLKSARSILGLPAQFTKYADPKVGKSAFGRSYTNDILMDMPLCMITPGRPKFLSGEAGSKKDTTSWLEVLMGDNSSSSMSLKEVVNKLLDGSVARYYSFQSAYAEYMPYVNSLNNVMAMYLGIGKEKGTKSLQNYSTLNWENIQKNEITNGGGLLDFLGNAGSVPFYFDKGGFSVSESASNGTAASALDGVIKTAESSVKEAAFITNSFAGKKLDPFNVGNNSSSKVSTLSTDLVNSSSMIEQIVTNLKSGLTTVASGGNLILPEIWRESSFARSYSLDFHFATPYGDPESFLLNIGVPINYLLSLTLPLQFGANGYNSPFLIQAFAQGVFNCSLGIIESIQISKFGSGDAISRSGLPLEVKVSVNFKDLYSSLSLTKHTDIAMFASNIELIDFIACMSGVNLNNPDLDRKIRLFLNSKMQTITDLPGNIKLKIMDYIRNGLLDVIKY